MYLFIHLSVRLSVCLSVGRSVCRSVCLSISIVFCTLPFPHLLRVHPRLSLLLPLSLSLSHSLPLSHPLSFPLPPPCVQCLAGRTVTVTLNTCTACVAGKYKSTPGSDACSDCKAGMYSVAGTCTLIPILILILKLLLILMRVLGVRGRRRDIDIVYW